MFKFFNKEKKQQAPVGEIKVKELTDFEKMSIKAQNELIRFCFEKIYKLPVFDISRDKNGHAIIFTLPNNYTMDTYTIGMNDSTHQIIPFQIGTAELQLSYGGSKINSAVNRLGIHSAFRGTGVGSIMLQAIENYLVDQDKYRIYLDALRDYVDISENPKSVDEIKSTMSKEDAEQYIKDNFVDKNLYFYSSNGYVKTGGNANKCTIQMQKVNIKKLMLTYGIEKTMTLSEHKDQYPICLQFLDALQQAEQSETKNFFVESHNKVHSADFSPFTFNPTTEDFTNFRNVINHFGNVGSSFQNRYYRLNTPVQHYSTQLSNLEMLSKATSAREPVSNAQIKEFNKLYNQCVDKLNNSRFDLEA